jgi:hypothetical protein
MMLQRKSTYLTRDCLRRSPDFHAGIDNKDKIDYLHRTKFGGHMRTLVWSLILFFSFGSIARAQDKLPDTPTDDEINLMLSQLERAMDQYEVLIIQEDKLLAGVHEADTTTDKRLVDLWKMLNKGLRGSPQKFNSQGGFDLLILIDDAARNAALAATNASKQTTQEIIAGRTEKAELLVTLMQNASGTSTLLYTVSENCTALYQKYLTFLHAFVYKATEALNSRSGNRPKNK